MDYTFTFASENGVSTHRFLESLVQNGSAVFISAGNYRVGQNLVLRIVRADDNTELTEITGRDVEEIYLVLKSFFIFAGSRSGVSIIRSNRAELQFTVISNMPDSEVDYEGDDPLGRAYRSAAVLANPVVFANLWPMMTGEVADGYDEPFADDEGLLHAGAVAGSFLLTGAAPLQDEAPFELILMMKGEGLEPQTVLKDLIGVPEYVEFEDDYFRYDEPDSALSVTALPFTTDRGRVIEVRLAIDVDQTDQILVHLARRNAATLGCMVFIIEDMDNMQEKMIVRRLLDDGRRGASEQVVYD